METDKALLDRAKIEAAIEFFYGELDSYDAVAQHCGLTASQEECREHYRAAFVVLCGYDALAAQLAAVTEERDAAIGDILHNCRTCKKRNNKFLTDGKLDDFCRTCHDNNQCNWEWRGPQGAGEGGKNE